MNKNDIYNSIDKINPTELQKKRMLSNILSSNKQKVRPRIYSFKRVAAAAALIVFILCAGIIYPKLGGNTPLNNNGDEFINNHENNQDLASNEIRNVFIHDGKEYRILSDEKIKDFGFDTTIKDTDIGEVITTIESSPVGYDDKSLAGSKVYEYIPAQSQAVVVVSYNGKNNLYGFSTFLSYQNNQDEDISKYFELFNVKSASDIIRIEFYSANSSANSSKSSNLIKSVSDRSLIETFYANYSVMVNSSNEYFEALYNYIKDQDDDLSGADKNVEIKENQIEQQTSGAAAPGKGSSALANSKVIRMYFKSGIYFETIYYPNIKFISRHKVTDNFAEFLNELCK